MSPTHASLLSALLLSAPAAPEDPWRTVELLRDGDLTVRLKVKRQATLADAEWLALEFDNAGRRPLVVTGAQYTVNSERDGLKTGRRVSSGGLASGNTFDLFPDAWKVNPVAPIVLEAGRVHRIAEQPSNYGGALLGLAPPDGLRVRGAILLFLSLDGGRHLRTPLEGVPFEFDWLPPDDAGLRALQDQLRKLLTAPDRLMARAYLLNTLLDTPVLANTISRDELLDGLARRPGRGDGRTFIVRHLAKRFAGDPKVIALYRERLNAGDTAAVSDVALDGLWHPSFTETLVRLYETDPDRHGHALLALAHHRADWPQDVKAPERLSAVVRRREPILSWPLGRLADHHLANWASAVHHLAMTGDPAAAELLRPALDDRRPLNLLNATQLPGMPRTPRVCDRAAEAILTLLDGSPDAALRAAAAGRPAAFDRAAREALWDRVIADLKKRLPAR
jgi:hypothetical protein